MAESFAVRGDYITLGQLMKAVGLAGSGGEARALLDDAVVLVNGEPDSRRGRKLRPGDRVEVRSGRAWELTRAPDDG